MGLDLQGFRKFEDLSRGLLASILVMGCKAVALLVEIAVRIYPEPPDPTGSRDAG